MNILFHFEDEYILKELKDYNNLIILWVNASYNKNLDNIGEIRNA